jgi:cytochrome c-550 PedF
MKKISLALLATSILAFGHGSVTPQAIDTKELKQLGEKWLEKNPYEGDQKAIALGKYAYSENCARCHGLDGVSGGIAPDLRYLEEGLEGDQWFLERARGGAVRNGNVYMPPFEGVLNQEAMWAIRAYLITLEK